MRSVKDGTQIIKPANAERTTLKLTAPTQKEPRAEKGQRASLAVLSGFYSFSLAYYSSVDFLDFPNEEKGTAQSVSPRIS